MAQTVTHTIAPVFDRNSRVLILGTIPSPKSREYGFFYGHPQNRFWRVLATLFEVPLPLTNEEKKALAISHHIALWDVLASCSIEGASDSSIRDPVPNDLSRILQAADIRAVFTTGKKAKALYDRYCYPLTGREAISLPSPSPANCRGCTLEDLTEAYRIILQYC